MYIWRNFTMFIVIATATQMRQETACAEDLNLGSSRLIHSIDADRLATALVPSCRRLNQKPRFNGLGTVLRYGSDGVVQDFELTIGIYESHEMALEAGGRTMPQRPLGGGSQGEARWFFSANGCHMCVKNVFVLYQRTLRPKDVQRPVVDFANAQMNELAESLRVALSDSVIVELGDSPSIPRLAVQTVTRVARLGQAPDPSGYEVVVQADSDADLLFHTWSLGHVNAERMTPTTYKIRGSANTTLGRIMEIRAGRPTGEVYVLDVKDMVLAADRVEVTWIKRDMGKLLTDANRAEFIEKLRRGEDAEEIARRSGLSADEIAQRRWSGDDPAFPPPRAGTLDVLKQRTICEALAQRPTPECAPLFLDILNGNRPGSVKQSALRGLAVLLGARGLEHYRRIATDATQPFELRSEAVILIREFGSKQDIPLLRRIGEEKLVSPIQGTSMSSFVISAIHRLEAKDRVVPGD